MNVYEIRDDVDSNSESDLEDITQFELVLIQFWNQLVCRHRTQVRRHD